MHPADLSLVGCILFKLENRWDMFFFTVFTWILVLQNRVKYILTIYFLVVEHKKTIAALRGSFKNSSPRNSKCIALKANPSPAPPQNAQSRVLERDSRISSPKIVL